MSKEGFVIEGLSETYKMFSALTATDQVKIVASINRTALRKGLLNKMKAANRYFPSKRGKKKNPLTIVKDTKANTIDKRETGVQGGISGKYFHYRFIEFGTKVRTTRKQKAFRGAMRSRPFLTNVIENSIPGVLNYFSTDYSTQVKKKLTSLARKKSK